MDHRSQADCVTQFPQLVAQLFSNILEQIPAWLVEHGYDDIRTTHILNVFLHLQKDGERPGVLAQKAGMTPQAMGELISYLEQRGYVERVPDPNDGRGKVVLYADRGLEAAAKLQVFFSDMDAAWVQEMGEESARLTRNALGKLIELT